MRQRKTITTLVLIMGILAVGIAYAAISGQNLTVTGSTTAATSDANFDVHFTGQTQTSGDGTTTITIDPQDNTKATITVEGMTKANQTTMAALEIINDSADVDAQVGVSIDYDSDWWEVKLGEQMYYPGDWVWAGYKAYIDINITLLKTPATDDDIEAAKAEFTVNIYANPDHYPNR